MPRKIDLFKAALGNEAYLSEVNRSRQTQAQFHQTLKDHAYPPEAIIEFIQIVKNNKIRSLLIIYLLSQKEYLKSLKGESILDKLSCNEHQPSRLNAWTHQLDVAVLTPTMISQLTPEAAVTILCSIPHFHQLSKDQVDALVHQHLEYNLIVYWIKNFASMPNACYVLAHLMKTVYTTVFDILKSLEPSKKDAIINNIMTHLQLFEPLPKSLLILANQESHLILAMKLYLNRHYYQAYTQFIEHLTLNLLNAKYTFSETTVELLFALNHVVELRRTISATSELTNRYLRTKALEGNVSPFYSNGQLNLVQMAQNIPIKQAPPPPEESPLVEQILLAGKAITCIEYFLMHYKGVSKLIHNMLNSYLEHYAQQDKSIHRDKALHHLGVLLLKKELAPATREGIFTAFLQHPELYDEFMSHNLCLYDAIRILQYFGFQGGKKNYQVVFNLCQLALKKLHPEKHQHLIKIIQQAQTEAKTELQLNEIHGWFSGLIKYLKRCYIYGWSGFFSPISPIYVIPESTVLQAPINQSTDSETAHIAPGKSLSALLQEIESQPLTQELFKQIIDVLNEYSLKDVSENEYETRLTLHNLFYKEINNKNENPALHSWLMEHKSPFLRNQFRLLELAFKEKTPAEVDKLLSRIHEGAAGKLKRVNDELSGHVPEQREKSAAPATEKGVALPQHILEKAAETAVEATRYAQYAWNAAGSFFAFKSCLNPNDGKRTTPTP